MPKLVDDYKGYRIAIYSINDHYAVITPPGTNAVLQLGDRTPRSTVVEGISVCLDRARRVIDELVEGPASQAR